MDFYMTSLALGAVGLAAMALGGSGQHGHGSHGHDASGLGHGGGHAGHDLHIGHNAHGVVTHGAGTHGAHAGHASHAGHNEHGVKEGAGNTLLALLSPRVLFSVALGVGATGVAARGMFDGILLFTVAVGGGILFERLLVSPLWRLGFKFESKPALTLESAVSGEATVVSTFDGNGQGLISIEVDGQVLQVLGTLTPDSRALAGRVVVGTRVRIDDVDAARNRCTVSLL
jgi:hypothetical protein